jgi:hypothetical protein
MEGATQTDPTQQLKYGDKTHPLQTSSENGRYELYQTSGAGNDDDALQFTTLIHHSLIVEKAEAVTAGVDTALEQLKSSMAAISSLKQANKYDSPLFPDCTEPCVVPCCNQTLLDER